MIQHKRKMKRFNFFRIALAAFLLASCVNQTEYHSLLDENENLHGLFLSVNKEKKDLESEVNELNSDIEDLREHITDLEDIIDRAMSELETAERFSDIEEAINILDEKNGLNYGNSYPGPSWNSFNRRVR